MQEDFGAAGETGVIFMEAFAQRFHVDLRDFRAEAHFAKEEDVGLVSSLWRLVRRPKKLLPITVKDLVEAVQHKKFATPVGGAG